MIDILQQLLFCLCFTPLVLLWGGCCCEASCEFFTDDFSRADSDDPGDYTEVSGDWDIASSSLVTSSDNAILIADSQHPDGDANINVSVDVAFSANNDKARIILDYADSNNYWFAEFNSGSSGYIRIFQVSGGGAPVAKVTESVTISSGRVCASISNGEILTASYDDVSVAWVDTFTNPSAGLGTGAIAGSIAFDDLVFSRSEEGCPACIGCPGCQPSTIPSMIKLVVPALTNDACSDCASYAGTYFLTLVAVNDFGGSSCASYKYVISSPPCFGYHNVWFRFLKSGGLQRLWARIDDDSSFIVATWSDVDTSDPPSDCSSFVDEPLPGRHNPAPNGIDPCVDVGTTALVTTL